MAQFSKFIRPGYVRVDATKNPNTNVYTSAYKGDNKLVIIAINKSNSSVSQKFALQNANASSVSPWTTDANRKVAAGASINISNSAFTAQLPAQSVTTFVATLGSGSAGSTYEAETDTTLTNAITETINSGYNGNGYVNFNATTGASIQWNSVYCAAAGAKNVKFRYALDTGTRNLDVYVNGTKVISNTAFTSSGSWSTWGEKTIQVAMNAGINTVKVVTTGTEGPNLDSINVTLPIDSCKLNK